MNIIALLPFGLLMIAMLLVTITIHEMAHAYVADYLGDPTARLAGRLTLNPIPHIDLMGSIFVPLFLILSGSGFLVGWAKPVPFDPYNLRDPRRDGAKIALAGPTSNFILAVISSILLHIFVYFHILAGNTLILSIITMFIQFNVVIGLFNLLPFGPLDGFKIVGGILPEDQAHDWYKLERFGIMFLLFFILPFTGSRSMLDIFLFPVIKFVTGILIP